MEFPLESKQNEITKRFYSIWPLPPRGVPASPWASRGRGQVFGGAAASGSIAVPAAAGAGGCGVSDAETKKKRQGEKKTRLAFYDELIGGA